MDGSSPENYEFKKLYDLINDTDPKSYYKMDPEEYEASMGRDYIHLKEMMRDWGFRLHCHGLTLPASELETIFRYGLMSWYINKLTEGPRIALSLKNIAENVRSNNMKIKFYDFRSLMKFYNKMDREDRPAVPTVLQEFYRYPNYQILLKNTGWKHLSFHKHLVSESLMDTYLKFVQKIHESIEAKYITLRHIDSNGQKIMNTEILRDMIWSEELRNLGVIFHRWKVVVEKIGLICQRFERDSTLSSDQKEDVYSKLLFYDRFASRIQELIYLTIRQAISSIHEIDDAESTTALNLPIYQEILNWIRISKNTLKPYNETDLILKKIDYFFE
jgi:hypothetical protein